MSKPTGKLVADMIMKLQAGDLDPSLRGVEKNLPTAEMDKVLEYGSLKGDEAQKTNMVGIIAQHALDYGSSRQQEGNSENRGSGSEPGEMTASAQQQGSAIPITPSTALKQKVSEAASLHLRKEATIQAPVNSNAVDIAKQLANMPPARVALKKNETRLLISNTKIFSQVVSRPQITTPGLPEKPFSPIAVCKELAGLDFVSQFDVLCLFDGLQLSY